MVADGTSATEGLMMSLFFSIYLSGSEEQRRGEGLLCVTAGGSHQVPLHAELSSATSTFNSPTKQSSKSANERSHRPSSGAVEKAGELVTDDLMRTNHTS